MSFIKADKWLAFRRICLVLLSFVVVALGVGPTAQAADKSAKSADSSASQAGSYAGQGNAQGFAADNPLQIGTVVQLTKGDNTKVTSVSKKDVAQMYGVVIDPRQLSVTVSNASLQNEVFVATSGTYDVLVSNEAGPVQAGDFLTASSVAGVAMDAGTDGTTVLGRATGSFDGKNNIVGTADLKDSSGHEIKQASFGIIKVAISVQHNPNVVTTKANLPKVLERVGLATADKSLSPIKIYLSIAITAASIIMAVAIVYAGVRHAVISFGRNPLGKKVIWHGLIEITLLAILIVIIGLFAVYLLLKL